MEQDERAAAANRIDGDVSGAAIQAGSIYGGVHVHVGPAKPAPPSPAPWRPTGWAELPDLPSKIQFLLRAQARNGQELPYRLPGARRPSLATVYVRQDLGSGNDLSPSEPSRPRPVLDRRGHLVELPSPPVARAVRPPSRALREALDGDDHVLVTGGPGQGKSTLSLRLAADIADRWLTPGGGNAAPLDEPVLPLRLAASELAARLDMPFPQALAESVRAEYGALLAFPIEAEVLAERVVGCRWLLLVDGLDEVAGSAQRDRLAAVLASWASVPAESPYRILLTTRPIEGVALAPLQRIGAARYELQPFDEEALARFAGNWFDEDGDSARRFVRQIREAHLDELARVPLLATIAAIIFEQHGLRPLPDNQYELYEAYLRYLRSARSATPGPFDESCDQLLEHLGRVRLEDDTSLVEAAQSWMTERLPVEVLVGGWREALTVYLAAVGPLTRRGDDLRFLHHSFAEHLAATAKARLLPDVFDAENEDFAGLLHAAGPGDHGRHARLVLLHHTRMHPVQADRLVRHLHGGDGTAHVLAARLLAWHVPASAEVAAAFLVTVHAWAKTTQLPCHEILAQTSRAAHHPGLADWLLELMRDQDMPWESRVEAATALATRLRRGECAEALASLRAVVDDAAIPVEHRLSAAESLSQCGGDERQAALLGLRSVLVDPAAPADQRRTAAVVLAGLGAQARATAIEVLTALLDDQDTPDDDLVEAATGLVEISVEFHERCATVFRAVLARGVRSESLPGEAVLGLASLGQPYLVEVVGMLENWLSAPSPDPSVLVPGAALLAQLGPQYRDLAGERLLGWAVQPGLTSAGRVSIVAELFDLGGEFQNKGIPLARAVLADRSANAAAVLWAVQLLADLGPDQHPEAALTVRRVLDKFAVSWADRVRAQRFLAGLGEPYRTPATAALRAVLADRAIGPANRLLAANALVRLGPEFHEEVTTQLFEITDSRNDPVVRVNAWRGLMRLGVELSVRASTALLELMGPGAAESWEIHRSQPDFGRYDVLDFHAAASVLKDVLGDLSLSGRLRAAVAESLFNLGRVHHRSAADAFIELLRSDAGWPVIRNFWITDLREAGVGLRARLFDVLLEVALSPPAPADCVLAAASALKSSGLQTPPELAAALLAIVADETEEAELRGNSAVFLAHDDPAQVGYAGRLICRLHDEMSIRGWEDQLRELPLLNGELLSLVRALVSDSHVVYYSRAAAATVVSQLSPLSRDEAIDELRSLTSDEFLLFDARADAWQRLVKIDANETDAALAYCRSVMESESEDIGDRAQAAVEIHRLDRSCGVETVAALLRFAREENLTLDERADVVDWLHLVTPDSAEMVYLTSSVVHHGAISNVWRRSLADSLPGKFRWILDRSLLRDRLASIHVRLGGVDVWEDRALAMDAEAELREVAAAAETPFSHRIRAAVALAGISPALVSEAAGLLESLGRNGRAGAITARRQLARLGRKWRRQVVSEAGEVLEDESSSWRERLAMAELLVELSAEPSPPVVRYLRGIIKDQRVAHKRQLDIMSALGDLDRVRAVRDDERAGPAVRWAAANLLRRYSAADRVRGARVLTVIATDPAGRPALRWRAARSLLMFGARGRGLGVAALRDMVVDNALPVLCRVDAARALGSARPDLRGEMLVFLRGLRTIGTPLERVQVLDAIGLFEPDEGAQALRVMALDRVHGSVIRLRCAQALAELHRDYRDTAAAVAREIARDESVARHVRWDAAAGMALLSETCRAEARELLARLG